ncbi:MAG: hypothetical protein ACFCUG_09480 [Thiotrichales bacterium]
MADLSIDSNLSGSLNSVLSGSLGAIGPVTVAGIPDDYTFSVQKLPKIEIGFDPLAGTLTLKPISLQIAPIETHIAIKEIPSVRVHLPANYALAVSWFGFEIAAVRLCGEGQVITEPYRPNPCEGCGAGVGDLAQSFLELQSG